MKASRPKPPIPEPLPLKHSFSKGCHYENMKGTYEVLSLDGNTMRIRWENGEESETDVKLQDRILSRFEREVRAAKARPGTRQADADPDFTSHFGPCFRGLTPTDFTLDTAETTWRSRTSGIGSAVTQEFQASEFCFAFWVPFRKPMILWTDVDRRIGSAAQVQTGFFCRLDEARAYYGFFVERSSEADGKGDWHRLLEWLTVPEQEAWLRSLATEHALRIFDGRDPSSFLEASGAQWVWTEGGCLTDVPSLAAFLATRPAEPGTVLECAVVVEKDRAVRRALKVGRDIAQAFELLLPLYRACLGAGAERKPSTPARRRAAS
ncbi:MAG: hypothetical protein HZB55_24390 [Deltaproteobacteria bacterium]|nr:hypothetical protein [Deltaproteobacteria bacterium]